MTPITTATNTARPPIRVGGHPGFIAITPNGKTAYIASVVFSDNTVTPITTATGTTGPPIRVGSFTQAMAITPNGTTLYVVSYASDSDSDHDRHQHRPAADPRRRQP